MRSNGAAALTAGGGANRAFTGALTVVGLALFILNPGLRTETPQDLFLTTQAFLTGQVRVTAV
jgi:hypothetical protein